MIHVVGFCLMVALLPPIRRRVGWGLETLNRPACQGVLVLGAWLFLGVAGAFVAAIGIGVFEGVDRYRAHLRKRLPGRPWWI
jgi:hypothetical protein